MKNLAVHSLLSWQMIILPILTTSLICFSFEGLGECTFRTWEWKGYLQTVWPVYKMSQGLTQVKQYSWPLPWSYNVAWWVPHYLVQCCLVPGKSTPAILMPKSSKSYQLMGANMYSYRISTVYGSSWQNQLKNYTYSTLNYTTWQTLLYTVSRCSIQPIGLHYNTLLLLALLLLYDHTNETTYSTLDCTALVLECLYLTLLWHSEILLVYTQYTTSIHQHLPRWWVNCLPWRGWPLIQ